MSFHFVSQNSQSILTLTIFIYVLIQEYVSIFCQKKA